MCANVHIIIMYSVTITQFVQTPIKKKKNVQKETTNTADAARTYTRSRCTLYHKPINCQARTPKIGYAEAYRK